MDIQFDGVYYERTVLDYELGRMLQEKYKKLPWFPIDSHNRIAEFSAAENRNFTKLKQHLILGIRKTHKYVENHKVSDWLVPYTSSGCRAMCMYCYLVCNYNKCAYLRLFMNREEMLDRLLRFDCSRLEPQTYEIGSNSDLILENVITDNLPWTIERFARHGKGRLTFPTKFHMVQPLLHLDHQGKTIFRMSVNPEEIIRKVEFGTSSLPDRVRALNAMADAGYPVGILIAPVILLPDWKRIYGELLEYLAEHLCKTVQDKGFLEIIFMTYSFVHNAINQEAFPNTVPIFDQNAMIGRGRGKYRYRDGIRKDAEAFLREKIRQTLPNMEIVYFS